MNLFFQTPLYCEHCTKYQNSYTLHLFKKDNLYVQIIEVRGVWWNHFYFLQTEISWRNWYFENSVSIFPKWMKIAKQLSHTFKNCFRSKQKLPVKTNQYFQTWVACWGYWGQFCKVSFANVTFVNISEILHFVYFHYEN